MDELAAHPEGAEIRPAGRHGGPRRPDLVEWHHHRDSIDVFGTIYMPNTEFDWINAGNFKPKSKWTVWIVDGISWRGTGVININFDIAKAEIPIERVAERDPLVGPGRARLIR